MKQFVSVFCLAGLLCFAIMTTSQAQMDVQSDGAVKIGDLDKATNLNGSSLEIAVKKIFIYPTNNLNGAFTIFNNTYKPVMGGGGIFAGSSMSHPSDNLPSYVEPYVAGMLVLGTSNRPLGGIFTQELTTYNQSMASDLRIKTDISNIPSALASIRLLRPVTFNYDVAKVPIRSEFAEGRIGFIAQEVMDVFPDLVRLDTGVNLYTLDYVSLIPYLTKAIQEQDSILRQQQSLLQAYALAVAELSEEFAALELDANMSRNVPEVHPRTSVVNEDGSAIMRNTLLQNVPNPFNGETRIRYELSKTAADACIGIYKLDGQEVSIYAIHDLQGELVINSGKLKPGMYIYSLIVEGQVADTKRMVVVQ